MLRTQDTVRTYTGHSPCEFVAFMALKMSGVPYRNPSD